MSRIALKGNVLRDGKFNDSVLYINNGRICDSLTDCEIIDLSDCYVLPAFIELHAHGGGGYDFIDNTKEAFDSIFDLHLSHGVAYMCPTLCACDYGEMLRFLSLCKEVEHPGFLGVHLEGPFLSPDMCGAQNLSCIVEPTKERIEALRPYADLISRITLAPEINGAFDLVKAFDKVSFSIGHSTSDAKTAREAFANGFSSVTHLFCSTLGRHKVGSYVHGGLIEEALLSDCFVELIGDGHHVSRESLLLAMKCKGVDRICLVSDAMRGAGSTSDGESYLGAVLPENRVILEYGVAKLPDRSSFAGSLAVGDTMVKALVGYGIELENISKMLSSTPAKLLGLSDRGSLENGLRADITVLDRNYSTVMVLREGNIVYKRKDHKC